jgi:hypothetical protein
MRQDPNIGRHQQPSQWQIPRQRVPYEGSDTESPGDRSWHSFSRPMSDLTNPASQRGDQPADGQQPLPVADADPDTGLDLDGDTGLLARSDVQAGQAALQRYAALSKAQRPASRMKAISLALAVAAALAFFVSLADRQLTAVTAIARVVLMLAALANYRCLARKRWDMSKK